MKTILFTLVFGLSLLRSAAAGDPRLSVDPRVDSLIARMTLPEKISQMMHASPAIPRLGIPAYNWWNECLHGVGRSGDKVTVFPQAIGLAATFNPEALERTAAIISDEARAIYNATLGTPDQGRQYTGLTFWTPNINIFRDPRWGRGQETYGEDPWLTGRMGTAMVRGLQGDDPQYLKTSACAKHYAVHSGPEPERHEFDVTVSARDLWDTYLPAFRTLVREAGVSGVMCAYNRYEGQPCCGSDKLMRRILTYEWDFQGYVTSDCWGVSDFHKFHKTHPDAATASADAVLHGTDLECGNDYASLMEAVKRGLITEEQIDLSLRRLFMIRFRLGQFEPEGAVPYDTIPYSILSSPEHKAQALEMARQSMVLLCNDGLLPLRQGRVKTVALLGPNADNGTTQLGNYNGFPAENVTLKMALEREPGLRVIHYPATGITGPLADGPGAEQILKAIAKADVIIFAGGISPLLEGEAGDTGNDDIKGFLGGDRSRIELPEVQTEFMKRFRGLKKPLIFVNMSGSAVAFPWEAKHADAIIQAWYGGQETGNALADILFGRYNPAGRLPVTFYNSTADLPDFRDYGMQGRTYRYYDGEVLYPFGYGLSYNAYTYGGLQLPDTVSTGDSVRVSVEVRNRGRRDGDEVVQLYVSRRGLVSEEVPICALAGVQRVHFEPGERKTVTFVLTPEQLGYTDEHGNTVVAPGRVRVWAGGRTPNAPAERFGDNVAAGELTLTGDPLIFDHAGTLL